METTLLPVGTQLVHPFKTSLEEWKHIRDAHYKSWITLLKLP